MTHVLSHHETFRRLTAIIADIVEIVARSARAAA